MDESLKIGVVGGSIGGCAAAAELSRAGFDVTVFERSVGDLEGRGAGIGTPMPTFNLLVERDLIDADTPRTRLTQHALVGRDPEGDPLGRAPLQLPLDMATLHWKDLWQGLRSRVPDASYRQGAAVARITGPYGPFPTVLLEDGSEHSFDVVVFADGYRSSGRAHLFPDVELDYRGYVLWRGLIPEGEIGDAGPLEDTLFRFSFPSLQGNGVFYFVPGEDGSTAPGERLVNWAHYLPVTATELPDFLIDKDGHRHSSSLPPGGMRPKEEARLNQLVARDLPPYFAELTARTANTFAQPIYTCSPPAYRGGRACLIGDAGAVVPPFTGSGVFKAANNAIDLAAALSQTNDVDAALAAWSDTEVATGRRLTTLGKQMEQAFVWSAPDLGAMDEMAAQAWWTASITFPDGFTYIATDGD